MSSDPLPPLPPSRGGSVPPLPPHSGPVPPAPPPIEMLKPASAHVPLTPMMDFLQRRLESLERDLTVERERALSAEGQLKAQEALRSEVEAQIQSLSAQIKREKIEKDGAEEAAHARGRIDSLEKRLDEMHQSWADVLREAMGRPQGSGAESAAALRDVDQRLAGFSESVGESVGRAVSAVSAELGARLQEWEKKRSIDDERQSERAEALARERAALQKAWEEQNHVTRQEYLRESLKRQSALEEGLAAVAGRVDELKAGQGRLRELDDLKAHLARAIELLSVPEKTKDRLLTDAERENGELKKALKERSETLVKYVEERRQIEASLGTSLMAMSGELSDERKRSLELQRRAAGLEGELGAERGKLAEGLLSARRAEDRAEALLKTRDELARAVAEETRRCGEQASGRRAAEEEWSRRLAQVQKQSDDEIAARLKESSQVSQLRAQILALTEQMTAALREKDQTLAKFAHWEREREELKALLRQKEELVGMLSSTFSGLIKPKS